MPIGLTDSPPARKSKWALGRNARGGVSRGENASYTLVFLKEKDIVVYTVIDRYKDREMYILYNFIQAQTRPKTCECACLHQIVFVCNH